MIKGQKVVCINDTFPDLIRAIYKQLPVKGVAYTIREVFLGREKVVKGGDSATVGLLLAELTNPKDPFHQGQQELGFSSERFAPLQEKTDDAEISEEAGELVFEIVPDGDKDLRADIFKAAVAADLVLLGLEHQGENLEDIFRDLTRVGEA